MPHVPCIPATYLQSSIAVPVSSVLGPHPASSVHQPRCQSESSYPRMSAADVTTSRRGGRKFRGSSFSAKLGTYSQLSSRGRPRNLARCRGHSEGQPRILRDCQRPQMQTLLQTNRSAALETVQPNVPLLEVLIEMSTAKVGA